MPGISRTKSWLYQSPALGIHTVSLSPHPTAGRLLTAIVFVGVGGSTVSAGWTLAPNSKSFGTGELAQYMRFSDGTETTFTVNLHGGSAGACIQIYEWLGPNVAVADVAAIGYNGSIINTSNTGTTAPVTKVGELVIAAFALGTGFNVSPVFIPPMGFSPLGHQHTNSSPTVWDNLDVCYRIVPVPGPLTATATFSESESGYTADIVAYSNGDTPGLGLGVGVGTGTGTHMVHSTSAAQISQPQLSRSNAVLRGARETKVLNYEVQSLAYDIYNLYYKQNVIQSAFDDDLMFLHTGSTGVSPGDLTLNATFPGHDALMQAAMELDRRVAMLENAKNSNL